MCLCYVFNIKNCFTKKKKKLWLSAQVIGSDTCTRAHGIADREADMITYGAALAIRLGVVLGDGKGWRGATFPLRGKRVIGTLSD